VRSDEPDAGVLQLASLPIASGRTRIQHRAFDTVGLKIPRRLRDDSALPQR
jgi:hypothetical protein